MSAPPLSAEWVGDTLCLSLNRPASLNALSSELLGELALRLRTEGSRAGAVVLTGSRTVFSSGFDMNELEGNTRDLAADQAIGEAAAALTDCPAPVIAALEGYVHGAGVELALACDIRISGDTLDLALRCGLARSGLPLQAAVATCLTCGLGRAEELMITMRRLDAETARAWGLIGEIVPAGTVREGALALGARLAASPRSAVVGTKQSFAMISRPQLDQQALEAAELLRRSAASSPERTSVLSEALKRLRGQ